MTVTPQFTSEQNKMMELGSLFKDLEWDSKCVCLYLLLECLLDQHNNVLSETEPSDDPGDIQFIESFTKDRDLLGLSVQFMKSMFFVKRFIKGTDLE